VAKAKAIADALRAARRILLVNHESPDGDCLGSSLALALALRRLGRDVVVGSSDGLYAMYGFLPGASQVTDQIEGLGAFDVAVGVECSDLGRAGRFGPALAGARVVINIDHHRDNSGYGDLVWQDAGAASVAEMFAVLLRELGADIDADIATCLMTGVLTDTGSFRYPSVRSESFRLAADLVARGAHPDVIYERVFESRSAAAVRLLGVALSRLALSPDGAIVWTLVDGDMLSATGATWSETEHIVGALRAIEGVRIAILFKIDEGQVKVSLRARAGARANEIAVRFGGGGHVGAAGFTAAGAAASVIPETLAAADEELKAAGLRV
jgi:phosphoesterase RecJ-like protein